MDKITELLDDIASMRGEKSSTYLENLLEEVLEFCDGNFSSINKKYHCSVYVSKEKHNALQYTYYYSISSDLINGEINLEVESGINNGTVVNGYSFEGDLKPKSQTIEVMKDIIFNEEAFDWWFSQNNYDIEKRPLTLFKAKALFDNNKDTLLKLHKENSYDNYVTGGGTNVTDRHYDNSYQKLRDKNVFWKYVYEEIEADINWV